MTEQSERVPLPCPACSPGEPTVHEVLSTGGQATVRCGDCGHVHKETMERPTEVTVDVVVSQDGESHKASLDAVAEESVAVGDEFVVDTEAAIQQVRVTAIETGPETRVESAGLGEVDTVWTRVVDNVGVNVTIHPKEGDGRSRSTRSERVFVPGDYEWVVGETYELGDETVEVVGVKVRDSVADDYRFEKMDHEGDMVFAKDAKRVYARDTQSSAWSAWGR